jgi:hypothetical protein
MIKIKYPCIYDKFHVFTQRLIRVKLEKDAFKTLIIRVRTRFLSVKNARLALFFSETRDGRIFV